jgi:hypothetical protein
MGLGVLGCRPEYRLEMRAARNKLARQAVAMERHQPRATMILQRRERFLRNAGGRLQQQLRQRRRRQPRALHEAIEGPSAALGPSP